jgi:hypothetical protein
MEKYRGLLFDDSLYYFKAHSIIESFQVLTGLPPLHLNLSCFIGI